MSRLLRSPAPIRPYLLTLGAAVEAGVGALAYLSFLTGVAMPFFFRGTLDGVVLTEAAAGEEATPEAGVAPTVVAPGVSLAGSNAKSSPAATTWPLTRAKPAPSRMAVNFPCLFQK